MGTGAPNDGGGARIRSGSLLVFRFLDVAEELDLERAELAFRSKGPVRRVPLRHESSAALALDTLPVEIELGPRPLALAALGRTLEVVARLRLFRFGVVAVVLEAPIAAPTAIADLVPITAALWDSTDVDETARALVAELAEPLAQLAGAPLSTAPLVERYGVVSATDVDVDPLASPRDREPLARLLLGESDPRPLASSECEDVLRHAFRYFADDLAIVHTTSALVVEPSGQRDVVLALELACSQILELRVYDGMIDQELDRLYTELTRASGHGWWVFGRSHRALSRRAQKHMVELSELIDRAESAVKVASDLFLGRVYLAALDRQHAGAWRETVSRKLRLFAQVYDVLKEEAHAQRSLAVEVVIVLLIAVEIVMALLER